MVEKVEMEKLVEKLRKWEVDRRQIEMVSKNKVHPKQK